MKIKNNILFIRIVLILIGLVFLSSPAQVYPVRFEESLGARRVRDANSIPVALSGTYLEEKLQGLSIESWQYRTAVIPLGNGWIQAVKFLKDGESPSELEHEAEMLEDLRAQSIDVPVVIRGEDGSYVSTYSGNLSDAPREVDISRQYISYITREHYFTYPENIKDPQAMRQCAVNSVGQFVQMLKAGYVHKSLSPLTHEKKSGRQWYWSFSPIGGMENLKGNLSYSNISLLGLRDFAHAYKIVPTDYLYFDVGQALSEWAAAITYHSLNNGFTDEEITEILKVGFEAYLNSWGLDSGVIDENIDKLTDFITRFRDELPGDLISSLGDGGIATVDNLVGFVKEILTKTRESAQYRQLEAQTIQIDSLIQVDSLVSDGLSVVSEEMFKDGNVIYAFDWSKRCPIKINLNDGSIEDIASGSLIRPMSMVKYGDMIYVADGFKECLVEINLRDGSFRDLAPGSLGRPIVSMVKDGDIIYVADGGKQCLVEINLRDGSSRDLAPGSLSRPERIIKDGDMIYVADEDRRCLVKINLNDGSFREIAPGSLSRPREMVKDGDMIYVADEGRKCLVEINLNDGSTEYLARGFVFDPRAMVKEENVIYLVDWAKQCLIEINLSDGSARYLARGSVNDPGAMIKEGNILYVADGIKGLVRITLPE